jgi:hypothetical protein
MAVNAPNEKPAFTFMKIIFLILVVMALAVTGCVSTPDHNGISNGSSNIKESQ